VEQTTMTTQHERAAKRLDEIGQCLYEVSERLDSLAVELARMPSWKTGTPWHSDRVREQQRLRRKTDWLMEKARALESLL
jgi:acyl-CoA reductase-like NAD-dependent aldehyde dehydrogenase